MVNLKYLAFDYPLRNKTILTQAERKDRPIFQMSKKDQNN